MDNIRVIDTRDSIKVVTADRLITAQNLCDLSLKARKVLMLIIAQCRLTDSQFFEYRISPLQLSECLGIGRNHVYEIANDITDELMQKFVTVEEDGKRFKKYSLFTMCEYDENSFLRFQLSPDMAEFLLGLKNNFTQVLLGSLLGMRSTYSMEVYHLMLREMKELPGSRRKEFYLSLEELRQVTGTQNKLKQLSEFKARVLDKAIAEIKEQCATTITYKNRKNGRTVIGFDFVAFNIYGIDLTDYVPTLEVINRLEEFKNKCQKS